MRILDRYILKQFAITLLFSVIALYVIFLIVDMLENLDDFIDQDMTFYQIAKFYFYFFPEILKLLFPVAMLLSTLFTIGKLSTQNEVTAMKSGGISLYRLMIPLMVLSFILSGLHLYFNGWVVPKANIVKNEMEHRYLNKGSRGGSVYNLYFRESPTVNLSMQSYNSSRAKGYNIGLDFFTDTEKPRLEKTIEAAAIEWDSVGNIWMLKDVIVRTFDKNKVESYVAKDSMQLEMLLTHQRIVDLKRSIDEMTFDELKDYLTLLEKGGRNVKQEMTDYYGQYAFPFASIIVVLFGIPFASVKKKSGIAVQIGAALVISFLYLIFTKVSQVIVLSAGMSPLISGWLANGLFFVVGIINLIKTKT